MTSTQRPASEAIMFSPPFSFEAFESPSPVLAPQITTSFADNLPSSPVIRIDPAPPMSSVAASSSPAPLFGLKGKKSRFSMIGTKSESSNTTDSPLSRKRSSKLSFSPSPQALNPSDEQQPSSPSPSLFARKLRFRSGLGSASPSSSLAPRSPSLHRATLDPAYLTGDFGVAGSASSVTLTEGEEGWVGVQRTGSVMLSPPGSSPTAEGRGKGKGGQGWYAGKRKNDKGEIVAIGPDGVEYVVMKLPVKASASPSASDSASILSRTSSARDSSSHPSPASFNSSGSANRASYFESYPSSTSSPIAESVSSGRSQQLAHRPSHASSISSMSSTSSLGQEIIDGDHPTPVPSQPSTFASPARQGHPRPSSRSSSIASIAEQSPDNGQKLVRSESRTLSQLGSSSSIVMHADIEKDSPDLPSQLLPSAPSPPQQPDQPRPFQNWESHSPSSSLSSIATHPSSSSDSSGSSAIFDSTSNNSMDTTSSSLTSVAVSSSSLSLSSQASKSSKPRRSSLTQASGIPTTSNASITKAAIVTLQKELHSQQARHEAEKDALIFALSESKTALSSVRKENSSLLQEVRSLHILLEEVRKALEEDGGLGSREGGLSDVDLLGGRMTMASTRSLRTLASRQSLISLASFVGGTRLGGDMEREIRGMEESLSAKFGMGRRWLTQEEEADDEDMDGQSILSRSDDEDDGETTADEGDCLRGGYEDGQETEDEDSSLQLVRAELVRTLPLPPSSSPVTSTLSFTPSLLDKSRYSFGSEETPIRPKRSSARLNAGSHGQDGLGLIY